MLSIRNFNLLTVGIISFLLLLIIPSCSDDLLLHPKGKVGEDIVSIFTATLWITLGILLSVFVLVILIYTKYRASKNPKDYDPYWTNSKKVEISIWTLPILTILVLSYLVVVTTHQLDPYKELPSKNKKLTIQVISTEWNWLFIYPEYNVASINEVAIPLNTPVEFQLTSNNLMTSFFIPQLGSQMYAMAGMETKLNLMASDTGVFEGRNYEFNGEMYNQMSFSTLSLSNEGFYKWLGKVQLSEQILDSETYTTITIPNSNFPKTYYSNVTSDFFHNTIKRYMGWMGEMDKNEMK